jgi:tRNA threonylcarbamoyladenosine biosynthesis protein TsaB
MLILSLDSAGSGCGACVWRDSAVLASAFEGMERGQDQRLIPLILEVMKQADVTFDDLDRIAVTRGPGSFTGLRIGLAAARGIGIAASKPVLGIDRFNIFREQLGVTDKNILVVINSKRKELFCRFYRAEKQPPITSAMTRDEVQTFLADNPDTIVIGDVPEFSTSKSNETITAAILAACADINDLAYLPRPLYLRDADVTMKKTA